MNRDVLKLMIKMNNG